MKKFLFTLAALMMAGTLSAEEYCYIDNFEVAQNELGTELALPVKAHFDAAVNAGYSLDDAFAKLKGRR